MNERIKCLTSNLILSSLVLMQILQNYCSRKVQLNGWKWTLASWKKCFKIWKCNPRFVKIIYFGARSKLQNTKLNFHQMHSIILSIDLNFITMYHTLSWKTNPWKRVFNLKIQRTILDFSECPEIKLVKHNYNLCWKYSSKAIKGEECIVQVCKVW